MTGWRLLCSGLVFVATSTTAFAGLSTLAGRTTEAGAWTSLVLGFIAAALTARGACASQQKVTIADTLLFIVFAFASLRAFLWVIYPSENALLVLSPHNLGDMALHLNLIHRWANGGAFWPENPFLSGAAFAYHPGMDLWNALLRFAGIPIPEGLRWAGLLGAAATAAALWRWGRGFAIAGFLFAGGIGSLSYFSALQADTTLTDIAWKNPFLTMFVTQRGWLYSLPAGLVLMTVWRAELTGDGRGSRLPVPAQVALYATMPFFNAPAFLFLSALLAACAIVGWRAGRARMFITTGIASLIPATWLVWTVTARFTAPSALRFAPGWMQEDGGLLFWVQNFGLFLPLTLALGVVLLSRPDTNPVPKTFFAIGTGTLAFSFLFLIAPWAWDNTKLILWGYLCLLPFLWERMIAPLPKWARNAICILLFAAGAVTLVAGLDARHGYRLIERNELADMQMTLRHMPPNARLACAGGYDHPALLLGQPVTLGYEGHLSSQGLDYESVQRDLNNLMNGTNGWRQAARRLGVRYLFWGKREKRKWPQSTQSWKTCAPSLTAINGGELFLLTPCLLKDDF